MKSFNTYKFSMNPGILTKLSKFYENAFDWFDLTVILVTSDLDLD